MAAQIRSIRGRASLRCLLAFQVRVEERDDPAAGIVRGRLVIPGVRQPGHGGLCKTLFEEVESDCGAE